MEANHPYNPNGKYSFNAAYDDDSLLDVTKGRAIVYDVSEVNADEVNINRKKFCDGFRLLFVKLNKRIQLMGGITNLIITDFKAISFDLVKVYNTELKRTSEALFPVELEYKNPVTIKKKAYKVTINMDNPTALPGHNMDAGPQGTHFSYSIISLDAEFIGHILINTFIGFPSRNKKNVNTIKVLKNTKGIKYFKFSELGNILADVNYVIPYDLISSNTIADVIKGKPESLRPNIPKYQVYCTVNLRKNSIRKNK